MRVLLTEKCVLGKITILQQGGREEEDPLLYFSPGNIWFQCTGGKHKETAAGKSSLPWLCRCVGFTP